MAGRLYYRLLVRIASLAAHREDIAVEGSVDGCKHGKRLFWVGQRAAQVSALQPTTQPINM